MNDTDRLVRDFASNLEMNIPLDEIQRQGRQHVLRRRRRTANLAAAVLAIAAASTYTVLGGKSEHVVAGKLADPIHSLPSSVPTSSTQWGNDFLALASAEVRAADRSCLPDSTLQDAGWDLLADQGPVAARDFAGRRVLVYVSGRMHGYCLINGLEPGSAEVSLVRGSDLIPELGNDSITLAPGASWDDSTTGLTTLVAVGRVADNVERVVIAAGGVSEPAAVVDGFYIACIEYDTAADTDGVVSAFGSDGQVLQEKTTAMP